MATSLTYPVPQLHDTSDLTKEQIHELLRNKASIARRVRTLADQRFIADALLTGRYKAVGGALLYENGDPIEIDDDPESVAPGGDYARSQAFEGDLAAAKTDKWGRDVPILDESIARRGINPVDRAINQLINRMVRFVDRAALGVIASKVTQTSAAVGNWTTATAIVESVELAKARAEESGEGHVLDTIVLKPSHYAKVMAVLADGNYLPREQNNPLTSGWPQILDLTWLRSPHVPSNNPLILNTSELGGMADEDLGGPGYSKGYAGIETKAIRKDENDSWLLRARRVTVPVVTDATAGTTLTGTGLA